MSQETENDQVWLLVKPNRSENGVAEMNAKMMAWHPALDDVRREDHSVMRDTMGLLQPSLAQIFESIVKHGH